MIKQGQNQGTNQFPFDVLFVSGSFLTSKTSLNFLFHCDVYRGSTGCSDAVVYPQGAGIACGWANSCSLIPRGKTIEKTLRTFEEKGRFSFVEIETTNRIKQVSDLHT